MENKKAQLNISFGAIFSIIIIVATLAIAGYIIYKFLDNSCEVKCGMVYTDFSKEINTIWASDGETSKRFQFDICSSVEKVCFGYLNQSVSNPLDKEAYDYFKRTNTIKENLYFYPASACGKRYKFEIKNAQSSGFFCVDVKGGTGFFKISKEIGKKVLVSE